MSTHRIQLLVFFSVLLATACGDESSDGAGGAGAAAGGVTTGGAATGGGAGGDGGAGGSGQAHGGAGGSGPWQLPEGHYVPRKMDMQVVYPRAQCTIDGVLQQGSSNARHLFAYPGLTYEIPIGIQGGAWPFRYELEVLSNTAGGTAAIGETVTAAASGTTVDTRPEALYAQGYGIVRFTPDSEGEATFRVTVYDQDHQRAPSTGPHAGVASEPVTIEWTVTVTGSTDRWLILDASSGDDLTTWTGGGHAGKICMYQDGDYAVPLASADLDFDEATHPMAHIRYPGHEPRWIWPDSPAHSLSATTDLFVGGLALVDADGGTARQMIGAGSAGPRVTFFHLLIDNFDCGTLGGAPACASALASLSTCPNLRQHWYFGWIELQHVEHSAGCNQAGGLWCGYGHDVTLFEHCSATSGTAESFIRQKAGHQRTTVRNVQVLGGSYGDVVDIRNGTDGGCAGGDFNEICFSAVDEVVWNWSGGGQGSATGAWWGYRNSLGTVAALAADLGDGPVHEMEVVAADGVSDHVAIVDAGSCADLPSVGTSLLDQGLTWDDQHHLTGTCRDHYVESGTGVWGHELWVP